MELVYLWVEEYKNIRKQGFNFSPRFECEFKAEYDGDGKLKDNCRLEIKPKEYMSIFPPNINVTAIVGENGSGKSSVSSIIQILFFKTKFQNSINAKNSFILYRNNEGKNILLKDGNFMVSTPCYEVEQINISNSNIDLKITFPSFDYSATVNPFLFNIQKNKSTNEYFPQYPNKFHSNNIIGIDIRKERENTQNMMVENYLIDKNFINLCKDIFEPYTLILDNQKNIYLKNYTTASGKVESVLDTTGKDISMLSHGELQFLNFINHLFNFSHKNTDKNTFIVFFDEIELSLHPNWQKRIIGNVIKYLINTKNKKFHLIFLSHSPFILSDLPKENVIFLEKGEQKNPFENGQTFGANIHTLLSHGFFMRDGLMGEFAKEKINDVYNFLIGEQSNVKTKEEAENIINLIGEPLIKKQLQKLFDDRFDRSNLTLDNEIELLEKKLEALRKLKK